MKSFSLLDLAFVARAASPGGGGGGGGGDQVEYDPNSGSTASVEVTWTGGVLADWTLYSRFVGGAPEWAWENGSNQGASPFTINIPASATKEYYIAVVVDGVGPFNSGIFTNP